MDMEDFNELETPTETQFVRALGGGSEDEGEDEDNVSCSWAQLTTICMHLMFVEILFVWADIWHASSVV